MANENINYIKLLEKKIDEDLGYNYYKKYIAASFWAQISLPINLVITFITAITTAQATSENIIP